MLVNAFDLLEAPTPLPLGLNRQGLNAETVAISRFCDVNLGIRAPKAACPSVNRARSETLRTTPSRRARRYERTSLNVTGGKLEGFRGWIGSRPRLYVRPPVLSTRLKTAGV